MGEIRQFRQNKQIANGISAESNLKMFDIIPGQHENLATNTNEQVKISIAQTFCEPVAVCSTNNPPNGHYTATCVNFPDFAVSFVDSDSVRHNLIGLKLRVVFEHGITYGSVAAGTFPTLSVNESEPLPLLAQGKTMAQGAIVAGQSVEFTIIPYGNSIAFDADSNVRENTNDYTIYTDGKGVTNIITANNMNAVTSNAVNNQLSGIKMRPFSITIASVVAGEVYFKNYEDIGLNNNITVISYAVEFIGGSSGFDYSGCLYFRDINKQAMYKCEYTQQNLRIYGIIFYT